jgi:EAL domain-containing protein (putative c-di-GMP-specific phosphodiesterase class I)
MSAVQLAELISLKDPINADSGHIERVLRALRKHLGMDVAFVSRFRSADRVFMHVDAEGVSPIKQGDVLSLEVGYCQRVVDGALPELIADTSRVPLAMSLPETAALPIGSHMSVPIYLSDGNLYGTFCCFGFAPDQSLSDRDLQVMRAFAELVTAQLELDLKAVSEQSVKHRRISELLQEFQPSIVYQPIFDAKTLAIVGWEALSRFTSDTVRTPDLWFQDATQVGLGIELECRAVELALLGLSRLPDNLYVSINCSPQLIFSGRLTPLLHGYSARRIVLEITEHAVIYDYECLQAELVNLRRAGIRLAIDDAGAGFTSMRQIVKLAPDMIKLDISLTRGIDQEPTLRAMASALIAFARETNSTVIAEGVETTGELDTLRALGAQRIQGFLLGIPMELHDAQRLSDDDQPRHA